MTKLQMNNSPCDSPVSTNERSLLRAVAGNRAFLGALVVSGAVFLYSANSKTENSEDIPPQPVPAANLEPEPIPEPVEMPVRNKVVEPTKPVSKPERTAPERPIEERLPLRGLNEEKRLIAYLFMGLPQGEFEHSIEELGLQEVEELSELIDSFSDLKMAIESGNEKEIEALATEFLKIASKLETSEVTREYWALMSEYRSTHEGSEDETDDKNPESHLYMIKSVLISARDYAEKLASL